MLLPIILSYLTAEMSNSRRASKYILILSSYTFNAPHIQNLFQTNFNNTCTRTQQIHDTKSRSS